MADRIPLHKVSDILAGSGKNRYFCLAMKFDVTRQSPLAALFSLAVLLTFCFVAAFVTDGWGTVPVVEAPLGKYTALLVRRWPVATAVVSVSLLFSAGVRIGRAASRWLFSRQQSYLTMPVFGIAACGVTLSADYLTQAIVLWLGVTAVCRYYAGFQRRYSFDAFFVGSFCVGALPLFYAPALCWLVAMPSAVLFFRRTRRETLVALTGLLLPVFLTCYAAWVFGDGFCAPLRFMRETLPVFMDYDPSRCAVSVPTLLAGLLCLLSLCAVRFLAARARTIRNKVRKILIFNLLLLLLSVPEGMMSGGASCLAVLSALPVSFLVPFVFSRFHPWLASSFYFLLWALSLLIPFVGYR